MNVPAFGYSALQLHQPVLPQLISFELNAKGSVTKCDDALLTLCDACSANAVQIGALAVKRDQEKLQELLSVALSGQAAEGTIKLQYYVGKKLGLLTLVPQFNDDKITGAYALLRDVTRYALRSRRQYLMEYRLAAIFENDLECVAMVCPKGKLIDVNPVGLEYMEVTSKAALIGGNTSAAVLYQDRHLYDKMLQKAGSGKSCIHELRIKSLQGNIRWVSAKTVALRNHKEAVYAVLIFAQDITQRKEAMQRLATSEQKFKAMVQNGSDIVAIIDKANCFSYLSPSTLELLGYEPQELLRKTILQFIHPDDAALIGTELEKIVTCVRNTPETTHRFRHRKGHWIWLESKAINLLHDENIQGIIINARDITHHKQLEAQLAMEVKNRQKEITNAVIKAQERERAQLGQELHDNVNQVLTTIKLYNEMLLEGIGESADLLPRSILHLQNCINEIRSISKRLSAPTLGKISLRDSIGELVQSINLTNRLQISYHIEGLDGIMVPQELHLAIYRIIQEQLNNVLKYAGAQHVIINICNKPTALHLSITDDGQGFDTAQKSSGIGITNMKTRAESYSGIFRICSKPGNGCTVDVLFPAVGQPA